MKKIVCFILILFVSTLLFAQVIVDDSDMPVPDDTLLYKITNSVNGIDYLLTGTNFIWDFSSLTSNIVGADTFVTVTSTPLTYNIAFNNPFDLPHKATVASPQPAINPIPLIQFSDVYNFYKNSTAAYSMVGFGARINGVAMPVKYDNPEVFCNFPFSQGNIDSTISFYDMTIPSFGYYGETRKRINYVDGWGVLYLPHDTFQVVRMKSELFVHDTIHLDTLGGFSQAFNRSETEYKWLAQDQHRPVLLITKRNGMGGNTTINYFDDFIDSAAIIQETNQIKEWEVYPNPVTDKIFIRIPNSDFSEIFLFNEIGRKLKYIVNNRQTDIGINVSDLPDGIYFIQIRSGNKTVNKKIIIQ